MSATNDGLPDWATINALAMTERAACTAMQADILPSPENYARDSNFINLPSDLSRPVTEMFTGCVRSATVLNSTLQTRFLCSPLLLLKCADA
eukprot:SAG22_NODE_2133_length_2960_cov_2.910870_4_plen_92_part_00